MHGRELSDVFRICFGVSLECSEFCRAFSININFRLRSASPHSVSESGQAQCHAHQRASRDSHRSGLGIRSELKN